MVKLSLEKCLYLNCHHQNLISWNNTSLQNRIKIHPQLSDRETNKVRTEQLPNLAEVTKRSIVKS